VLLPRQNRRRPPEPTTPASDAPALRVAVLQGRDAGQFAPLAGAFGSKVAIGSARENALVLHDERVSPRHLEVWATPEGIGVRDLGSQAGTYIGAIKIGEAIVPLGTRLRAGDSIVGVMGAAIEGGLRERLAAEGLAFVGGAMAEIAESIARLAPFNTSVLVEGETGTGKEVVARALHRMSMRQNGPFVLVDCGALPASLIESELFGHEKGAFTSAERKHEGAFERAHGGTLLLDEIGELPLTSQPALLGALQRRSFRRVGGHTEVSVDVRVLAATNRDLLAEVERGTFRADLYYRLASARLVLPPLRHRLDDLPALVEHLLTEVAGSAAHFPLDEEALRALRAHPWKGNVRELRAVVERAVVLGRLDLGGKRADGERPRAPEEAAVARFEANGSPAPRSAPGGALPSYRDARAEAMASFEQRYLGALIEACQGNASEASRVARMDRPHLLRLLRRHGLR
jgi:DNA-binding NtrC family response regulator